VAAGPKRVLIWTRDWDRPNLTTGRHNRRSDVRLILVQRTSKRRFEQFDGLLQDLCRAIPGRALPSPIGFDAPSRRECHA
jgi:hypothetical protein